VSRISGGLSGRGAISDARGRGMLTLTPRIHGAPVVRLEGRICGRRRHPVVTDPLARRHLSFRPERLSCISVGLFEVTALGKSNLWSRAIAGAGAGGERACGAIVAWWPDIATRFDSDEA
jgi:hypothetical protein